MILCNSLFFQDKNSKIRIELDRHAALAADSQPCQAVSTIILLASLTPVQTNGTMAPIIADIINRSISRKPSWVTLILKKPLLDLENFKNFRPISNLSFLAKTLEKVVSSQLQVHVQTYILHDKFQSAYRPHTTGACMFYAG